MFGASQLSTYTRVFLAAATPMSIFGSLGVASVGFKTDIGWLLLIQGY